MSYSRWSESDWYVFENTNGNLDMWHVEDDDHRPSATFAELDGITEDALAALVPGAPRDSIPELLVIVRRFCDNRRAGVVE